MKATTAGTIAFAECKWRLHGKIVGVVLAVPVGEAEGNWVVDKIVAERRSGSELKVRWEGYAATGDTWEPRGELEKSAPGKVQAFYNGVSESESEGEEELHMDDVDVRIITDVEYVDDGWVVVTKEACARGRVSHDGQRFEAAPFGEVERFKVERRLFKCIKRFNDMGSVARDMSTVMDDSERTEGSRNQAAAAD